MITLMTDCVVFCVSGELVLVKMAENKRREHNSGMQ